MAPAIPVPHAAYRAAYLLQHAALSAPTIGVHSILRALTQNELRASDRDLAAIRKEYERLLAQDLRNAHEGLYPRDLLFRLPIAEYAKKLPELFLEFPRTVARARRGNACELPSDVDLTRYPKYYRRNFHWQADGYLSRRSAELYDVSVEFLFLGAADVMRRQVIPPITRHLRSIGSRSGARILDVACGTGTTLRQIAAAHPAHQFFGLDLSPYYVSVARNRLVDAGANCSFVAENAETMPYRDGWFDVVTSVYLFHELPKDARRNVMNEMWRVLKPGGLLVIEDSAQPSEAPELAYFLGNFSAELHEPFYKGYLKDDLSHALTECGFEVSGVDRCFVAKVVTARKPLEAAHAA